MIVAAAVLLLALIASRWRDRRDVVSGFLEADDVRVGSRVGGRVRAVHVEEGQHVTAGALLVELEPFDLQEELAHAAAQLAGAEAALALLEAGERPETIARAQARRDELAADLELLLAGPRPQEIEAAKARVALAGAELELARKDHERASSLTEDRVTSQAVLDRAENELEVADATLQVREQELALLEEGSRKEEIAAGRARLAEAEAELALAQAGARREEIDEARARVEAGRAAVHAIERSIEELSIRTPIDSMVEGIELEPGDLVVSQTPVLTLIDPTSLWVRTFVPEDRLDLATGMQVHLTVDALPGERFPGEIVFVSRKAEFTPGNVQTKEDRVKQVFRVRVRLTGERERLRAGMIADVHLDDVE